MKDAFGSPQSLLVLGGTSEIGLATARRLIARRTRTVWLAGRPSPALETRRAELRSLGADVRTVAFDALDSAAHEEVLGKVFAEGDIDMVLLAFGVLGDQANDEADPPAAVRVAQTNYTGAVSAGLVCARRTAEPGARLAGGALLGGGRARPPRQLHLRLQQGGPGRLRTGAGRRAARDGRARDGRTPRIRPYEDDGGAASRRRSPPPPRRSPRPIELGLRRSSETVWVPGALRVVMSALRHVPRPLFRRLPL